MIHLHLLQIINNNSTGSSLSPFEKFQRQPCPKHAQPGALLFYTRKIFFAKGRPLLKCMTEKDASHQLGQSNPPTLKPRSPQTRENFILLELLNYAAWRISLHSSVSSNLVKFRKWAGNARAGLPWVPWATASLWMGLLFTFLNKYHVANSCLMQTSWRVWCNHVNTFL